MTGATEALQTAAMTTIRGVAGFSGVYPGAPVQAVPPYALVETGAEGDWGYKEGIGREVMLTLTLRDAGESPARIYALIGSADTALDGLAPLTDWRLVSFVFLRSRVAREGRGADSVWLARIDYRARMIARPGPG
ncbi:MAG TPA: DUF3168 domain-containing protein [Allosphingosinicella sp.]|jgi:hypothetical protein